MNSLFAGNKMRRLGQLSAAAALGHLGVCGGRHRGRRARPAGNPGDAECAQQPAAPHPRQPADALAAFEFGGQSNHGHQSGDVLAAIEPQDAQFGWK